MIRRSHLFLLLVAAAVIVVVVRMSASAPAHVPVGPLATPPALCTRFASETGSDSQRGTWRKPFKTAERLAKALRRGETGCLRRGIYTSPGDAGLEIRNGGITIRSYPGEQALLRGNVVVYNSATGVRLARLRIEGTGGSNTIQVLAADFTLEDSDVTNAWRGRSCMILGDSEAGTAVRPVIRRNRFHECGIKGDLFTHAFYSAHVTDGRITDNVIWNIGSYAIQLYPDTQRTVFAHNVVDGTGSVTGGVIFGGDDDNASRNNVVEFNVIAFAKFNITETWEGDTGTGNIARSNCVYGGRSADIGEDPDFAVENNVSADPAFVDRGRADYRLSPNSRCRPVVGYDTVARLTGK